MVIPENSATLLAACLLLWHIAIGVLIGHEERLFGTLDRHWMNTLALLPFILFAPLQSLFEYYDSARFVKLCTTTANADSHFMLALGQVAENSVPLFFLGVLATIQLAWLALHAKDSKTDIAYPKGNWPATAGYFCVVIAVFMLQSMWDPQILRVWVKPAYELLHGSACNSAFTSNPDYYIWASSVLLSVFFTASFHWFARKDKDVIAPTSIVISSLLILVMAISTLYMRQFEVGNYKPYFSVAAVAVNSLLTPFYTSALTTLGVLLVVPFAATKGRGPSKDENF